MSNKKTKIRTLLTLSGITGLAWAAGCMTLEQMAPPIDAGFELLAKRQHVDLSMLKFGRQVYLMDCARCHSVEPISRYSESRWREILPRMGKESKLDAEEQAAVNAYVLLAHTFLEEAPSPVVRAKHAAAQ